MLNINPEQTKKKWEYLIAKHDVLVNEKGQLINKINSIQEKIDDSPNILSALETLQKKVSEENRNLYEGLLTNLLHEILPSTLENNERVIFRTQLKQQRMHLDIDIVANDNKVRDVYLDKGGSVHNVIAMGLRLIALSVSQSRRFVIFDEADCWLRSEYVPAFTRMLSQLSKKVGMQIIYISHHPETYFSDTSDRIILTRKNNKIIVNSADAEESCNMDLDNNLSQTDHSWLEGIGLRFIRLKNVKQHEYSEIKLSQNVTLISGDNDVGKSTIIQAFDAIKNNKGRSGLIRDGAHTAEIELGLEDDMVLHWRYRREGQRKARYQLLDNEGNVVKETYQGNGIPDWLNEYLGMSYFDNWDIHISEQSQSAFLLDRKFSGSQRANILSLNKNDQIAQIMLKNYREEIKELKQNNKHYNEQLKLVKTKLSILRALWPVEDNYKNNLLQLNAINESNKILEKQDTLIKEITSMSKKRNQYNKILQLSIPLFNGDNKPTEELLKIGKNWAYYEKTINVTKEIMPLKIPTKPVINSTSELLSIGKIWGGFEKKGTCLKRVNSSLMLSKVEEIEAIKKPLSDSSDDYQLSKLINDLNERLVLEDNVKSESKSTNLSLNNIQKELNDTWEQLGGKCPTCNQIHKMEKVA